VRPQSRLWAPGRSEPGEGSAETIFVKTYAGHHTNGASPQPHEACLWPLLHCKNLTHLHQIFDFKISTLFPRLRSEKVAPAGQLKISSDACSVRVL
jgi:hypothetical protein